MHPTSDVAAYAANHPETTELLPSGKLRFTQSGMDFPATATEETLKKYKSHGLKRALTQQANAAYDFTSLLPYVLPHPERDEKHFMLCKLTGATLPRQAVVMRRHVASKRFQRLKAEEERKRAEREARRLKMLERKERAAKDRRSGDADRVPPRNGQGVGTDVAGREEGEDTLADEEDDDEDDHMRTDKMAAALQELVSDGEDDEEDEDEDEDEGDGAAEGGVQGAENEDEAARDDDEEMGEEQDSSDDTTRAMKRGKKGGPRQRGPGPRAAVRTTAGRNGSGGTPTKAVACTVDEKKDAQKKRTQAGLERKRGAPGADPRRGDAGKRRVQIAIPRKMRQARQRRRVMAPGTCEDGSGECCG